MLLVWLFRRLSKIVSSQSAEILEYIVDVEDAELILILFFAVNKIHECQLLAV